MAQCYSHFNDPTHQVSEDLGLLKLGIMKQTFYSLMGSSHLCWCRREKKSVLSVKRLKEKIKGKKCMLTGPVTDVCLEEQLVKLVKFN